MKTLSIFGLALVILFPLSATASPDATCFYGFVRLVLDEGTMDEAECVNTVVNPDSNGECLNFGALVDCDGDSVPDVDWRVEGPVEQTSGKERFLAAMQTRGGIDAATMKLTWAVAASFACDASTRYFLEPKSVSRSASVDPDSVCKIGLRSPSQAANESSKFEFTIEQAEIGGGYVPPSRVEALIANNGTCTMTYECTITATNPTNGVGAQHGWQLDEE